MARRILDGEARKKTQLHDVCGPRIVSCQLREGVVEAFECDLDIGVSLQPSRGRDVVDGLMCDSAPAFVGKAAAGVIDEPTPHFAGHESKECVPVFHRTRTKPQQTKIRFVQQGRGLQGMPRTFAADKAMGESPELVVGPGYDNFARSAIASAPGFEKLADLPVRPVRLFRRSHVDPG